VRASSRVCCAFPWLLATVVLSSWGCSGKIAGDDQRPTASDSGSDASDAASEAPREGGGDTSEADALPIADSHAPPEDAIADAPPEDSIGDAPPDDSIVDALPDFPCPIPIFSPMPGPVPPGTNVTITANGTYIFYTTDGTRPTRSSPVYDAGTAGIPLVSPTTIFSAFTSTLDTTCFDSAVEKELYTLELPD
jgi:Chitobiase/beta-hexosaminidase C-terminal domain